MILIFLHALHLHSFPFQDNKMFLNWLKLAIFHGGDSLCNILKHSNAIVRILLICRDGTFAICKSSSYVLL
jgi:hypothetical protein